MRSQLRSLVVLFALFTVVTGVFYPVLVTAVAAVFFPTQAQGSLVVQGGRVVGSTLIGQPFEQPGYFWGRPSATGPTPYNGAASTGSNLGPTNPALVSSIRERISRLRAADPKNASLPIPVDLVTASGSGLDPHISPAGALFQASRVARARALPEERIRALIDTHIERRTLGFLGEPRVNVLKLNLALDALAKSRS
jgi:potassium-transporting ATPase KdpC subunit